MKSSLLTRSAAIGAAAVALTLATAAPAMAGPIEEGRSLPAGDSMYTVDCSADSAELPELQIFGVVASTGVMTTIGSGAEIDGADCAGNGAVDPRTGLGYYVGWGDKDVSLISVDLTTGVSTKVATFEFEEEYIYIEGIAIGDDGEAYALGRTGGGEGNQGLFEVDLATGGLTFVAELATSFETLVVNPADDHLYGLTGSGDLYGIDEESGDLYGIDDESGELVPLASLREALNDEDLTTRAMAIDGSGIFWVGIDTYNEESEFLAQELWSFDYTDVTSSLRFSGPLSYEGNSDDIYTEALLIAPAPAVVEEPAVIVPAAEETLAETGVSDTTPMFVVGALGAALIGGVLLYGARLRRRSNEV
jgi:LPXTG-motif cell wall-anchored protein